jgi:hypothetical protein
MPVYEIQYRTTKSYQEVVEAETEEDAVSKVMDRWGAYLQTHNMAEMEEESPDTDSITVEEIT